MIDNYVIKRLWTKSIGQIVFKLSCQFRKSSFEKNVTFKVFGITISARCVVPVSQAVTTKIFRISV